MEIKYGRTPVNRPEEVQQSGQARFNNLFLDTTDGFKLKRKDKFGIVSPVNITYSTREIYTCGESILGGRALALMGGFVVHFQPGNPAHFEKCIGVSAQAGQTGTEIEVCIKGLLPNLGDFLNPDSTIYSGQDGTLTDIEPPAGYILQAVGQAKDAGTLFVEVSPAFILS